VKNREVQKSHAPIRIRRVDTEPDVAPRLSGPLSLPTDPVAVPWDWFESGAPSPRGFGSPEQAAAIRVLLSEPVHFVHHLLKHKTWAGQREILSAVRQHPKIAVKAAHAGSKTFAAAELTLWWLARFPTTRSC
jgi:hypothetical protein